jgi:hypothetical protein
MTLRTCCFWFFCLLCTDSIVAQVRLLNDSNVFVSVQLKGRGDTAYRGPWRISPHAIATIPVAAGDYRVRVERADGSGKRQVLPLRDYSDCEITYHISLCTICAPKSKDGGETIPLPVETVFISRRAFRPNFAYGAFRLGVSVTDDKMGARVTAVEADSPAVNMTRVGGDDAKIWLKEESSIITHVNGRRVTDALEFNEATASSSTSARFTVYSTTRGNAVEYQTTLRD